MADSKGGDPVWALMLFVAAGGLALWLVWYFFQAEILSVLRYVRLAELGVFSPIDERARACFTWLWQAPQAADGPVSGAVMRAAAACYGLDNLRLVPPESLADYYALTPTSIGVMADFLSSYTRWIAAGVCIGIGAYALYFSPRNKFKTRYNLEGLIKIQAKMWPVIAPIVNFNPAKHSARVSGEEVPDRLPLFAEALSPEEWVSYHRIPVTNGIPDKEAVRNAFLPQLGPRWRGFEGLPPYQRALAAAFALKGAQKREKSDELLGRIATCWSADQGFTLRPEVMAEVDKLLKDSAVGGAALKIAQLHAWRTTALLGILKWARLMGGVLAPAQFIWLRGEDRSLWYPLNNLGRRTFHAEGAGALAHFLAEEGAHKPLIMPRLETAIVTLNQYLAANPVAIPPRAEPKRGPRPAKASS